DSALEMGPHPQVIVSRSGLLTFANLPARTLFGIGRADLGRPFRDLDVSYQPSELRTPLEQALRERRRIGIGEIQFRPPNGEERTFDVTVVPLLPSGGQPHGVASVFEDVSRYS